MSLVPSIKGEARNTQAGLLKEGTLLPIFGLRLGRFPSRRILTSVLLRNTFFQRRICRCPRLQPAAQEHSIASFIRPANTVQGFLRFGEQPAASLSSTHKSIGIHILFEHLFQPVMHREPVRSWPRLATRATLRFQSRSLGVVKAIVGLVTLGCSSTMKRSTILNNTCARACSEYLAGPHIAFGNGKVSKQVSGVCTGDRLFIVELKNNGPS